MKRVALTADLQLQAQPRYSTLTSSGVTSRLLDFVACLDWIVDSSVMRGCDALFILGDLFDSRTVIDVSVIDLACRAFARASSRIELHALVGNHDAYLRSPSINSMQMLTGVVTVHESIQRVGPFVVVPWVDSTAAYEAALASGDALHKRKARNYLLSHGMFGDAVPMAKGMPIEWLTQSKWDGVFLGDVHDPVVLQKKPLIRYVGSPMQIHFGDAGRSRGFVVLDTETAKTEWVENTHSPRFHILREPDDALSLEVVTDRDFVRVQAVGQETSELLVEAAQSVTSWVESAATKDDSESSTRIVSAGTMSDEEMLRAYCAHAHVDADSLVPLGLELLKEAREA